MKKIMFIIQSALLTSLFFQSATTFAAVDVEVSAGAEQDSNLNIVELDKHSKQSDLAALLGIKIDGSYKPGDAWSVTGGYSFSSKTYRENSAFNLAIHQLYADANYNADVATVGISHHYANAFLDGDSFLALNQTSLYVAKLINNRIYLRGAANIQDKKFNGISNRNANNLGFSGDAFLFFNEGKTFVSVGISRDKENAHANQFDYKGIEVKAKVSHKFMLGAKANKVQLGWRHLERDYSRITPEINAQRYDSGNSVEATWELAFTPKISVETKLEKGNFNSNLASADYTENRASLTLKARF